MAYYHCSPTTGLTVLEPSRPESFGKPARVYMTTLLPMALMYSVRNSEYSYPYLTEKYENPVKAEESIAHIHGWDFSHLDGRYTEEDDLP